MREMNECFQTLKNITNEERTLANNEMQKVTDEFQKVKEELKLVKVEFFNDKALLATLKGNHPYLFEK